VRRLDRAVSGPVAAEHALAIASAEQVRGALGADLAGQIDEGAFESVVKPPFGQGEGLQVQCGHVLPEQTAGHRLQSGKGNASIALAQAGQTGGGFDAQDELGDFVELDAPRRLAAVGQHVQRAGKGRAVHAVRFGAHDDFVDQDALDGVIIRHCSKVER